jgi:site-specific DNA-cytosine methylase
VYDVTAKKIVIINSRNVDGRYETESEHIVGDIQEASRYPYDANLTPLEHFNHFTGTNYFLFVGDADTVVYVDIGESVATGQTLTHHQLENTK